MASVDDLEELIATRRLNGVDDGLYESDKNVANMTEEAFNEIIDNLEVVAYLTEYGRRGIKENVKKLQARIKELEEETLLISPYYIKQNYIPIQKISNKIEELKKQKEELKYKAKLGLIQRINAEIKLLEKLLEENK